MNKSPNISSNLLASNNLSSFASVLISSSSPQTNNRDETEWTVVKRHTKPKYIKNTKHSIFNESETNTKPCKSSSTKKTYDDPKRLKKSLFDNDTVMCTDSIPPKNDPIKKDPLRCYKSNQRRKRMRARKRAAAAAVAAASAVQNVPCNKPQAVPEISGHKENSRVKTMKVSKLVESIITTADRSQTQDAWLTVGKGRRIHRTQETVLGERNEEEEEKILTKPIVYTQPDDIWTACILPFLTAKDIVSFGCCSKKWKSLSEKGHIWEPLYRSRFPSSNLSPISSHEWKLAYKLSTTSALDQLRCSYTKKTFLEDVIGVGIDYTINPRTKAVDYISTSLNLLNAPAFMSSNIRTDVFGNEFKLFLPLYFSEEHFQRSLSLIKKTIVQLCPERKTTVFDPLMVLDVFPKIINTFVVLVSDEGLAASRTSLHGLIRMHRLFLALVHEYPRIKSTALSKLNKFVSSEKYRVKSYCPSIGNFLPLLMIVDQKTFQWTNIRSACLSELEDRRVSWVCKAHPQLENLNGTSPDERLKLTFSANSVSLRLTMLIVYFLWLLCKGSTHDMTATYDLLCGCLGVEDVLPSGSETKGEDIVHKTSGKYANKNNTTTGHLNFQKFRYQIHRILSVTTWQEYYKFVLAPCPKSKLQMEQVLKNAVKNSRKKKYHRKGMDFSAVHASGSSKILAKGQQYRTPDALRRLVFHDHWSFGTTMYLDSTCLMYAGRKLVSTIDYINTSDERRSVIHSGDVMSEGSGTHIINLDLDQIDPNVTTCVFILSAWSNATLNDVKSATITFKDADAGPDASPLCVYNLEAHGKRTRYLKSIIMCKLYRTSVSKGWHVLAIGDSHRGSVNNYGPIYEAVNKLL